MQPEKELELSIFETVSIKSDLRGTLRYHALRSFRLHNALLELIDNSVDAGARHVKITQEDGGSLAITDDGHGFKDLSSGFTLGKSDKTDAIGRYGIGMKDACLAYSTSTEIISNGKRLVIPWADIISGDTTGDNLPVTSYEFCDLTTLRLIGFDEKKRENFNFTEIKRSYHLLIEAKEIEIIFNGNVLAALELPKFSEILDVTISHLGKSARIHGGIYPPNSTQRSNWNGYNPYYKGRLIGNGKIQNAGVGETGCTNFCFLLELLDGEEAWGLATNKDEVSKLTSFLDEVVLEHTRDILERGAEAASDIALKSLEDEINTMLGGAGNITRSKREKTGIEKKESQKGSEKKNTNTATMSGGYLNGVAGGRLKFSFVQMGGETLGEFYDHGKGKYHVKCNTDNPFIAENKTATVGVMFAKMAFAAFKHIKSRDTAPGELISSIMMTAGSELAYRPTL